MSKSSSSQYHIETCLFYLDYNEAVYFNLKYDIPMEKTLNDHQ